MRAGVDCTFYCVGCLTAAAAAAANPSTKHPRHHRPQQKQEQQRICALLFGFVAVCLYVCLSVCRVALAMHGLVRFVARMRLVCTRPEWDEWTKQRCEVLLDGVEIADNGHEIT